MTFNEMIQATKAALDRRDSRRDILAAKIQEMATAALDASRASHLSLGEAGTIERRTLEATCSQWADGSRSRTNYEDHVVLVVGDTTLWLTEADLGFFDGHNRQHQRGPARDGSRRVRRATVSQLRNAARALPAAIATVLAETQARAEAEVTQADQALADL